LSDNEHVEIARDAALSMQQRTDCLRVERHDFGQQSIFDGAYRVIAATSRFEDPQTFGIEPHGGLDVTVGRRRSDRPRDMERAL
jgi:hypothetical protein